MNRLGFRPDVERLPIFGLGCGGGVGGLARAARMAQARPGSNVLFLTIDLCSLCLRINDPASRCSSPRRYLAMERLAWCCAAPLGTDAAKAVQHARACVEWANTSGRRPNISWAGISRTMASASC